MKNILLLLSVAMLLFSYSYVLAQEEETVEIQITSTQEQEDETLISPESPFYFLTNTFEDIDLLLTFDEEKRIEKALQYAERKLKAMEELPEEEQIRNMERLENRFEKLLGKAEKTMEKSNYSEESNAQTTQEIRDRHMAVLNGVLERVPEGQAQESIQKVIDKTEVKYQAKDDKIKSNNRGGNSDNQDDEIVEE